MIKVKISHKYNDYPFFYQKILHMEISGLWYPQTPPVVHELLDEQLKYTYVKAFKELLLLTTWDDSLLHTAHQCHFITWDLTKFRGISPLMAVWMHTLLLPQEHVQRIKFPNKLMKDPSCLESAHCLATMTSWVSHLTIQQKKRKERKKVKTRFFL